MVDLLTRPEVKPALHWLPVIFANGEDDDTPGLAALFAGEAVLIQDRLQPAGEDVLIERLLLVFDRRIDVVEDGEATITFGSDWPEDMAIRVVKSDPRKIIFDSCEFYMRGAFYGDDA